MKLSKAYPFGTREMLLASLEVMESFEEYYYDINPLNPVWNWEWAESIQQKITDSFQICFKEHYSKEAIDIVYNGKAYRLACMRDVSFLRRWITLEMNEEDQDQLFDELKFECFRDPFNRSDLNQFVEVVKTVVKGLNEKNIEKLLKAGFSKAILDRILAYPKEIEKMIPHMFTYFRTEIVLTKEEQKFINSLYLELSELCRIAFFFYHHHEEQRNKFVFSRVIGSVPRSKKSHAPSKVEYYSKAS